MKRSILSSIAFTGLLLSQAGAQTVATDPVGFTTQVCPASSDTLAAVPFTRPPEFVGATASATTNTITVSGTPWTANQFVYVAVSQPKTYFVLVGPHASTNPKEGRFFQITANGTNTLTVNANGDDLSTVAASTQILVIPFHTLGSIFPDSDAGVSFIVSPNPVSRQTQVLIPNYGGAGINLSASATYFYNNGAWRKFGEAGLPNRNDDAVANAGYFTVRNAATGTTLTGLGSVLTKKATIPLFTRVGASSVQQDNFVSLIRPVDVKLNDLGLITSGAFVASPNPVNRVDQLLTFDNNATGLNKSALATYFYQGGAWRKFGEAGLPDRGNDVIPANAGFVIRKGGTATGATSYWTNAPTY